MHSKTTWLTAALLASALFAPSARAQGWPEIFDPLVLRTINLQMSPTDWQTIQNDTTFDIEVPTQMWLDGEAPILVSIRRKSADPLNAAPGYSKVSYKIDINELVSGQNWHGLRAVSLDNGDDQDVVSEGLAWYLNRLASGPEGYQYNAGLASWVRLVINGVDTGVYVNAEQRDKRFLENRGLWVNNQTWLYEVEDLNGFELDEGVGDSPTFQTLCYSPFASPASCPTPDAATLASVLPGLVNMRGLLTLGAVDSFYKNSDGIFSHGKNFYFADYSTGAPRLHFPWDLDSVLGGNPAGNQSIYAAGALYSQILNDLVCGPFQTSQLHAFLDALEPVLSAALAADPNNQLGGQSVAEFFNGRKQYLAQRVTTVSAQIENFVPCGSGSSVTPFCFGDGTGAACPCGNTGGPGRGCANSVIAQGALLSSSGTADVSSDTLTLLGSGMPNATALYLQGTERDNGGTGTPLFDGLRCVSGTIVRLATKTNASNSSRYPDVGDPSVSVRGGVPPTGGTFHYQVYYRNASATFCPPETANWSNGLTAVWVP